MRAPHIEALRAAREAEHKAVDLRYDALERLTVPGEAATYDRDHLPPGFASPEAFASEARRLRLDPGTYKQGRGWAIPASVWERARREDRDRRRKPVEPEADPVDAMLAGSGLRLVRSK